MATADTVLTPAIREALRDALTAALDPDGGDRVGRAGARGYLRDLDAARDGEALGDLIDVAEYFVIDLDHLDA